MPLFGGWSEAIFGYTDMYVVRLKGNKMLICALTLRDGKMAWDLNGISHPDWKTLPVHHLETGHARWDAINPAGQKSEREATILGANLDREEEAHYE